MTVLNWQRHFASVPVAHGRALAQGRASCSCSIDLQGRPATDQPVEVCASRRVKGTRSSQAQRERWRLVFQRGSAQPLEATEVLAREAPANRHAIAAFSGYHSHSCHSIRSGCPNLSWADSPHERDPLTCDTPHAWERPLAGNGPARAPVRLLGDLTAFKTHAPGDRPAENTCCNSLT
jgi:hypothetical protein